MPDLFHIPSVSELTEEIKSLLELNFSNIMVEGEVSQPKTSSNGHIYFTLKDDKAQLPCVIWRSVVNGLQVDLLHGQQIMVGGDIQVYPPHGKYQLIVSVVKQAGKGALQKAFEELKQKLELEGLFDQAHKKPLPAFPQKIGVVTSSTGAAFQDIRSTLEQRYPLVSVGLYHASVQGVNAAGEIVKGIRYFSDLNDVDILIIGRGGGSLEDLWPFNEEAVARAIYDCPIPVISAVGHETDFSISDFVADVRAATPTQAASIAVPDINELRFYTDEMNQKLRFGILTIVTRKRERVERLIRAHGLMAVQLKVLHLKEVLSNFDYRLKNQTKLKLLKHREQTANLIQRLYSSDPNKPLEQGYVRIMQDEKWIRKSVNFNQKEKFGIVWKNRKDDITPR